MTEHSVATTTQRRRDDVARVASSAALLGASAAVALRRDVDPLESQVFRFLNRLPRAAALPLTIIMQAGALGASYVAAGLALATGRRRLARDLALGGTLSWTLAKGVKALVARERPARLLDDVRVHGAEATGLGYPSGHAAVSATLATVASPYLTPWPRRLAWVIAGLVSLSRVYVGAHLPVDIVGGVPLGVMVGAGLRLLWGVLGGRHFARPDQTEPLAAEQL
jgi:membrane-associated phospholipid phosphatase